jgi:signal transduction histidine kinase
LGRRRRAQFPLGPTATASLLGGGGKVQPIMKLKLSELSGWYLAALREFLERSPQASLEPARRLGRTAVALGLDTLDLARVHEGAVAALRGASATKTMGRRAEIFFTEANAPIERTHQAAIETNTQLNEASKVLERRTLDLAASSRCLKRSIARRKSVEEALKKSGGHSKRLLKESNRLERHLRGLTHQILAGQEDKRGKIGRDLQDEIAQTLLGINVRLLALRKAAALNATGLTNEIANTRRLVDNSVKSIKLFAREFGKYGAT